MKKKSDPTKNIMISATTGSGKSQVIHSIILDRVPFFEKVIIADSRGVFLKSRRTLNWNPSSI